MSKNGSTLRQTFRYGQLSEESYRAGIAERDAFWAALAPEAKLADLDRRLGVGMGAKRQRAKLAHAIEEAKKPKEPLVIAGKGADTAALKTMVKKSKRAPNDMKGRKKV